MTTASQSPFGRVLDALEIVDEQFSFEQALSEATASGLLFEQETDTARRLHQFLTRSRRRESLLRMLLDSATDLAAITDPEEVLQTIVRRTRTLLGSDMAYISLNDYESRETFIHTTDGVATEEYRNIRMELGTGVLGKIAGQKIPSQAIDYSQDSDIIHVPHIDRIVRNEGVRSIMGAPLLHNGDLLGALLVAERDHRQFSAEEMWLVQSMSSLASVVFNNAQLIDQLREALRESNQLQNDLEQEHAKLAEEQRFERTLIECAVSDAPYDRFLALMRDTFQRQIWVTDSAGRKLHGDAFPHLDERSVRQALSASSQSAKCVPVFSADPASDEGASTTTGRHEYLILGVRAGERSLGAILFEQQETPLPAHLLPRCSLALSVMLLMDERQHESDLRTQTELLWQLVRPGDAPGSGILARAARFGLQLGSPYVMHVFDVHGQEALALSVLRTRSEWQQSLLATVRDTLVLVHPSSVALDTQRLLAEHRIEATIGVASVEAFTESLNDAYESAHHALKAMLALGLRGSVRDLSSLGPLGLLLSSGSPDTVEAIIAESLGPLIAYDRDRNSELLRTLWEYFTTDRKQALAAQNLHVHVNTLRQRLDRVSSLLGDDWAQPYRSSQIFLALQIYRLQREALPN